jgi:hypothetical protein
MAELADMAAAPAAPAARGRLLAGQVRYQAP